MRRGARLALLIALTAATVQAQAQAQSPRRPPPAAPAPAAPPPPPEETAPPYEPELLRLAEIMGALSYLRTLCAGREAPEWRERMSALLQAEGTTPGRRSRLSGVYNRGFRAYAQTHRHCSAATQEASARLAAEGERLARALAGRYGG